MSASSSASFSVPPFGAAAAPVYDSVVQQTRDALAAAGYSEALIGLSGGLDSALVAAVAVAALGPQHVHGLLMPAAVSSESSVTDALCLARRLGIDTQTIPIEPVFTAFKAALAPAFAGLAADVTEENLQARIRGTLLMALSNKCGWYVLNTGNYSEALMGYGTLHGDMVGSFAPLGRLLKTQVYELARYANQAAVDAGVCPAIPEEILAKEPSAELAVGQLDRDALGPYEDIDPVLYGLFVREHSLEQLVAEGFNPATVRRVSDCAARMAFKLRYEPPAAEIICLRELVPYLPGALAERLEQDCGPARQDNQPVQQDNQPARQDGQTPPALSLRAAKGGAAIQEPGRKPGLEIRTFAPQDLPEEVRDLLYAELYRDFGVSRDREWLNASDGGQFLAAYSEAGELCGAGRLMPVATEPSPQQPPGVQIRQLATAPSQRGQGVGTTVLAALEAAALAQGQSAVWLKARQRAWDFYAKRGYQFEGPSFSCGECMAADGIFISRLTDIPHKVMTKRL